MPLGFDAVVHFAGCKWYKVNVMGWKARCLRRFLFLPIFEEHETRPMDSYAMSKVVNEETAKAFQRRTNRIGNVVEHEYHLFECFCKKPEVDPKYASKCS